jgi:hypothetical protein
MGIRSWMREQLLGDEERGDDVPPSGAFVNSALGRERPRAHALGEYDQSSYPGDLAELLRRRTEVSSELIRVDVTDREARIAAIPRLRELLRIYPHPLAYELLIHAYVDVGRFDEAKGVAFAARQRRLECERSEHPEIRAEVDGVHAWTPEEIDELRLEREGAQR